MSSHTSMHTAIVLVGHGGVPRDYPRERVRRLMALEAQRQTTGAPMGHEEAALDRELRNHPRTAESDPYKTGLERLAAELAPLLPGPLLIAYNEFCAPSVPDAVAQAVAAGAREVVLIPSMMTPGGSHSEVEIPELVEALRDTHRGIAIRYAWPFDLSSLARFMAGHLARFEVDTLI